MCLVSGGFRNEEGVESIVDVGFFLGRVIGYKFVGFGFIRCFGES